MAVKLFRIDEFYGLDQSKDENSVSFAMSPDACNMDTDSGALAVARGRQTMREGWATAFRRLKGKEKGS